MKDRDSSALLEILLATLPQYIFFKDTEGRFIRVSDSLSRFYGAENPRSVVGKTDFDYYSTADAEQYRRDEREILRTGKPLVDKEERCVSPTGIDRWSLTTKVPVLDSSGQIVGIAGASQDITERRRFETALRQGEERFRRVFEADIIGVHFWSADGAVTEANDAYLRMVGYTREDLASRRVRWRDMTPPEYTALDDQAIDRMKRTGACPPFQKEYICKNGKRLPILLCAAMLPQSEHEGVAFALDLTEQRLAEAALRESEQRFRTLAENSSVGFWRITPEGQTLYINPAMCRMIEIDGPDELQDRKHTDFFTSDTVKVMRIEHNKRMRGKPSSYEAITLGKRGGRRNVLISGSPLLDHDGKLTSLIGTFTDLTELKLAERELHQQRQEQEIILDSVPALIWYKDRENRVIRANKLAAESIGLTKEQIQGKSSFELYPEHAQSYYEGDLQVIRSGKPLMGIIERLKLADGRTLWLRTDKIPYRNEQGEIIGVIVFATDITDLKETEEALRREQQLMQILMDNMPDAIYFKDRQSRFLRTNLAHARIMGLNSPEEAIGFTDENFFAPEAAAQFRQDEETVISTGRSLINRIEHHSGQAGDLRWWSTTKVPIRDSTGEIVGIAGITREITQQKRADEEIRLLNQELERRVADRTAKLEAVNRALESEIAERRQAEAQIQVYQERLRSLASELSLAEERERRRIAVELHDEIGQPMALIQIKLQALRESIKKGPMAREIDQCVDLLGDPIQKTRTLVFNLSPPVLYDLGFEAAAAWLVEQHDGRMGIRMRFEDDEQPKPLDHAVAVLLFRAIRELLTNVEKHSRARQASVSLTLEGDWVCASVVDDGRGFDVAASEAPAERSKRFGLFSVREQIERIGGILNLDSTPGDGCRIKIKVPLKVAATGGVPDDYQDSARR